MVLLTKGTRRLAPGANLVLIFLARGLCKLDHFITSNICCNDIEKFSLQKVWGNLLQKSFMKFTRSFVSHTVLGRQKTVVYKSYVLIYYKGRIRNTSFFATCEFASLIGTGKPFRYSIIKWPSLLALNLKLRRKRLLWIDLSVFMCVKG